MQGLSKSKAHEIADGLLVQVGLGGFADPCPMTLSDGMQQRALAPNPKVLLMDDPFWCAECTKPNADSGKPVAQMV